MTLRAVCWDVSLHVMDGGGKRVQAFLDSLAPLQLDIEAVGVGPLAAAGVDTSQSPSALRKLKRRAFPAPMRHKVEQELNRVDSCTKYGLSLAPVSNRWTIRHSERTWLDFPDLMSDFSRNTNMDSRATKAIFSVTNISQSALWNRREAWESQRAEVVTTASWLDSRKLGEHSVWLPTPTHHRADRLRSERAIGTGALRYGFFANFGYPPNVQAFRRLVSEWRPCLELGGGEIVVGGFSSDSLPPISGIRNLGQVQQAGDFYDQIDVALAPISMGGGMKVKVVEAMSFGVPVIVTEHSRVGLPPNIFAECNVFGSSTTPRLRDPRLGAGVLEELELFEFESFYRKVGDLWTSSMKVK